jgi:P-type E1-E2 ATPase
MNQPELIRKFAEALKLSASVVVFRCSPDHKAKIVKFVKETKEFNHPVTVAIGDGANDVAMI